jgi:hypothetical protein
MRGSSQHRRMHLICLLITLVLVCRLAPWHQPATWSSVRDRCQSPRSALQYVCLGHQRVFQFV